MFSFSHSTFKVYVFLGLAIGILQGNPSPLFAGEQPNILIVGEDADEDTVPRNSRVFNRVSDALRTRMEELGFQVYNETATTMDITNAMRVRRTDAELIDVAKNIQAAPIDVIAAFQIYASSHDNPYSDIKQLRIRIVGRMLQVQSGRDLGNFEVALGPKGLSPLPVKCNRDCVYEHLGDEAKPIANELGLILARKLDEQSPAQLKTAVQNPTSVPQQIIPPAPTTPSEKSASKEGCSGMSSAYTIVLTGYDVSDINSIEQILIGFQGYSSHRPVRSQTRYNEIWYETCSELTRLERNMRNMVDQLPGQNRMALMGNKFEIEHIASKGTRTN